MYVRARVCVCMCMRLCMHERAHVELWCQAVYHKWGDFETAALFFGLTFLSYCRTCQIQKWTCNTLR